MRILVYLTALALFVPSASLIAQSDAAAIRSARARSNSAIQSHNLDSLASVWLPEYVSVSSTNARSVGRDSARANFMNLFATRPGVIFVRTPQTIRVNPAWRQAGESGHWTGHWSATDGVVRVSGDYFAKWRKVGDKWLLVAETFVQLRCTGGRYCDSPP
ncbi:MAG: nuclear transport factor 2 family protein [bacterium]